MSVLHQSFLSFTQRGKPLKKRVSEKFDRRAQFLSSLDLRKYNDSVEEIFRSTPPLDPRPKKFYGRNCDLSQKASTVSPGEFWSSAFILCSLNLKLIYIFIYV